MIEWYQKRADTQALNMDLMLARLEDTSGHSGGLDFAMDSNNRLMRAKEAPTDMPSFIYAGVGILNMTIFDNAPDTPHSLNLYFDKAIAENTLYGTVLEGQWITVGTQDALEAANKLVPTLKT